MKQKRFLTALAMVLLCMCGGVNKVYAQTYPSHSEIMERQRAEQKAKIGLDYSMPDFSTSKLSESVMGKRLAKILNYLNGHGNDFNIKSLVGCIFCEQENRLQFVNIEKIKIHPVLKTGNTITVNLRINIGKNPYGIKKPTVSLTFTDGISQSANENDLFTHICNYIR